MLTRNKWLSLIGLWILARLPGKAATPEHPNHMVKLDRLQVTAADNGKYLQVVGGVVAPSDGVPIPVFVRNASTSTVAGLPVIARDLSTGVLTLPSVPTPATSLEIYCNGIRQQWALDFTVNGAVVTPVGPEAKGVFINSIIVGDWQR
jgi:hypothetical protein